MTKVTILGEAQGVEPKKKIEFVKSIGFSGLDHASMRPDEFENVILISKDYSNRMDLMFAYNGQAPFYGGVAYLGNFNDGIV